MRYPAARVALILLISLGALTALGCDDRRPGGDASVDAGRDGDGGPGDSGMGPDAGPPVDAGPVECVFSGSVTYDRRPISTSGLGAPTPDALEGAEVVLLVGGGERGRTRTDADGVFCFGGIAVDQPVEVRVVAEGPTELPTVVKDFGGAVYSVRAGPFVPSEGPATVHITQAENAGAFAIYETMRGGLVFAREAFARTNAFPVQDNRWIRGSSTPGGTSYFSGEAIWLLGGPEDTDEYDVAVIIHELGHYIEDVYGSTDPGPGPAHNGADTDARQAWSEGWATHFSNLVLDSGQYLDSYGDAISLNYDVETLPASGEYVGRPGGSLSQNLSEWLIAASLFTLYRQDARATQTTRMMAVVRDWFDPQVTDRGQTGADFVDYLDGYLCIHAGLHRDVIQSEVVDNRTFPYDFRGSCPALKPGRPLTQRINFTGVRSDLLEPTGALVLDRYGRALREVRIR